LFPFTTLFRSDRFSDAFLTDFFEKIAHFLAVLKGLTDKCPPEGNTPLCSAPFDLIWGSHPLAHDQPSFGGVAPSTIRLHPRSDKKSAQLQKLRLPHRGVAHKNYRHAHRD